MNQVLSFLITLSPIGALPIAVYLIVAIVIIVCGLSSIVSRRHRKQQG